MFDLVVAFCASTRQGMRANGVRRVASALKYGPLGLRKLAHWLSAGQLGANFEHVRQSYSVARLLDESGLFDAAWYNRDPAIAHSRLGASLHYVLRGADEGRSPSPMFDGSWYMRQHPEAAISGVNPLLHYLLVGRTMGLATRPALPGEVPRATLSDASYHAWLTEIEALAASIKTDQQAAAARDPSVLVMAESDREACLERQEGRYFTAVRGAGSADDRGVAVLFVTHGIRLAKHAVLAFQLALEQTPDAQMIYGDEDWLNPSGQRFAPWFKPNWDPDLALACDLAGAAVVFRRSLLDRLSWDGSELDRATLRQFTLTASAWRCTIAHLPLIVSHRLTGSGEASGMKFPAEDINITAAHLAARGSSAAIKPSELSPGMHQVVFALPSKAPLVSIIIPTRDHAELLAKAAEGVLHKTDYNPIELLIIDNSSTEATTIGLISRLATDSRVSVVRMEGSFNWSILNNRAVSQARGDVVVLLNNDIEILQHGWLRELVAQALRPEIGAVGAKLLYPNGSIQHAGIALGPAGLSCHLFRGADGAFAGPNGELAVTRSVAAVTGACLAIRRNVFDEVGGFEEHRLGVTNNDIDLCLKVRQAGYRVVLAANAVLLHREAATRGADSGAEQQARLRLERAALLHRWGRLAEADPYLNSNLCVLRNHLALEAPSQAIRAWSQMLAARQPKAAAPWGLSELRPDISAI